MNQGKHAVSILNADGSTLAVTHWDRPEDALAQFSASLRLAGHPPHQATYHEDEAVEKLRQGLAYWVFNPEFGTGAVEIMTTPSKGVRMSTK